MRAKEIKDFESMLDDAERQANSDWEMGFVCDLQDRYEQYGGESFVSDNQLTQLKRIANR